jgi:hypothetical protein
MLPVRLPGRTPPRCPHCEAFTLDQVRLASLAVFVAGWSRPGPQTGVLLPRLLDVDWKLEYVVKSSAVGAVNQPTYTVKLTTASQGADVLHHVQFTCTPPQLDDLLGKVNDALRAVPAVAKEL